MSTPISRLWHRSPAPFPWLLLGGYTVATFDMLFAIAYWAPHGVSATRILQTIATWVLGPAAYSGGTTSALLGAALYGHLMWGVVAFYNWLGKRHPVLLRRPVPCGAAYGVLAYAFIFHVMGPLLSGTAADYSDAGWIAACVVVFMILVGIPCALFSRMASGVR